MPGECAGNAVRGRAFLVAPLLVVALLSGCVLPSCGPTTYDLTAVTASAWFADEAWDEARARAGLEAAGFTPHGGTQRLVQGVSGNASMMANAAKGGQIRLSVSFPARAQGSLEEVERAAEGAIVANEAEAAALLAAFERGANWTLDTPVAWDRGLSHGDC